MAMAHTYVISIPETSELGDGKPSTQSYLDIGRSFIESVFDKSEYVFAASRRILSKFAAGKKQVYIQDLKFLPVFRAANLSDDQIKRLEKAGARVSKDTTLQVDVDIYDGVKHSDANFSDNLVHAASLFIDSKNTKVGGAESVEPCVPKEYRDIDLNKFPLSGTLGDKALLNYKRKVQRINHVKASSDLNFSERPADFELALDPWHVHSVGVQEFCDRMGLTRSEIGSSFVVGIIDFGVDTLHDCFVDCDFLEYMEFRRDGSKKIVDSVSQRRDLHRTSHGTATCSMIGGKYVGVAPGTKFIVAALQPKEFNSNRAEIESLQVLEAMNWIADKLKEKQLEGNYVLPVLNLSLSIFGDENGANKILKRIREAYLSLPIAASGNDHSLADLQLKFPASSPHSLAIGAHTSDHSECGFSCRDISSSEPKLLAPGEHVVAARAQRNGTSVTYDYCRRQGTSIAAAITSGASAAICKLDPDALNDPSRLSDDLLMLTRNSNTPGKRILDLRAALA